MELPQETRDVFEYLMLDYRSASSFVNSSQVERYVKHGFSEYFQFVASELEDSPLKNDSDFEWSDPVKKARDIIRLWGEETPVGADPVLYLIIETYPPIFDDEPPALFMILFSGEGARAYKQVFYSKSTTILEYLLIYEWEGGVYKTYDWSKQTMQNALAFIRLLLDNNADEDEDIYGCCVDYKDLKLAETFLLAKSRSGSLVSQREEALGECATGSHVA